MKFLALDSGSKKWGYAIFVGREVKEKGIIESSELGDLLIRAKVAEALDFIVVGRRRGAIERLNSLSDLYVFTVDEIDTTMEAREVYFSEFPPKGLIRLFPRGLRVPDRPIDDFAAVIIGKRFLNSPEGIYKTLEEAFFEIIGEDESLKEELVSIHGFPLGVCEGSPDEGKVVEVEIKGFRGRAFGNVRGKSLVIKLGELVKRGAFSFKNKYLLVAVLNALFRLKGKVATTLHCEEEERFICAKNLSSVIEKMWGYARVVMAGKDPIIFDTLKRRFDVSPFDDYTNERDLKERGDLLIAFGRALFDGRLSKFLNCGKPVICCGPTMIAPSVILGDVQRHCPLSK